MSAHVRYCQKGLGSKYDGTRCDAELDEIEKPTSLSMSALPLLSSRADMSHVVEDMKTIRHGSRRTRSA